MIVDDDEGIRILLSRWLSRWGFEPLLAASADEALAQMTTEAVPIVLCDVMMPVHDGLWLAEQIHQRWPETALIMASGAQDMQTITTSRRHGAVDYVTKPFGREMVLQALRRVSAFETPAGQ